MIKTWSNSGRNTTTTTSTSMASTLLSIPPYLYKHFQLHKQRVYKQQQCITNRMSHITIINIGNTGSWYTYYHHPYYLSPYYFLSHLSIPHSYHTVSILPTLYDHQDDHSQCLNPRLFKRCQFPNRHIATHDHCMIISHDHHHKHRFINP